MCIPGVTVARYYGDWAIGQSLETAKYVKSMTMPKVGVKCPAYEHKVKKW